MRFSVATFAAVGGLVSLVAASPVVVTTTSSVCTSTIPAPTCSSPGPATTYIPEPCFPNTGVCYPTNYYAAQDEGQYSINNGNFDSQAYAKCKAVCDSQSQCASFVATENITPDGTLATSTCFFYSTQQLTPRQCADAPSRIIAYYKQEVCAVVTTTSSSSTTTKSTTSTTKSTTSSTTKSTTTKATTTSSSTTTKATTTSSSTTTKATTTSSSTTTKATTTSSSTTTKATTTSSSTTTKATTTSSSTTASTTSSSTTTKSTTTSSSTTATTTSSTTASTTTSSTTTASTTSSTTTTASTTSSTTSSSTTTSSTTTPLITTTSSSTTSSSTTTTSSTTTSALSCPSGQSFIPYDITDNELGVVQGAQGNTQRVTYTGGSTNDVFQLDSTCQLIIQADGQIANIPAGSSESVINFNIDAQVTASGATRCQCTVNSNSDLICMCGTANVLGLDAAGELGIYTTSSTIFRPITIDFAQV